MLRGKIPEQMLLRNWEEGGGAAAANPAAALPARSSLRFMSLGYRNSGSATCALTSCAGYWKLNEVAPTARNAILTRLRERIVAFAASHIARDSAEDLA